VTRFEEGVSEFELSRDGRILYARTRKERLDEDAWKGIREDFDKVEYAHGVTEFSQLWTLDLETWRSRKLVDERRVIIEFAVSPDGRRVAMLTKPDETLLTGEGWSRVDVLDVASGAITTLPDRLWREEAPSPFGWLLSPSWSEDGGALAFRVDFDGYPGEVFFAFFDVEGDPAMRKMTRPGEITVDGPMAWMPGSRTFCFLAVDHARARIMALPEVTAAGTGEARILTPGDVAVEDMSFGTAAADLAIIRPGLDHPGEVFLVENPGRGARYRRLTHANPQVDTWRVPRIRVFSWTAPDGTPVEGILELPADWEPSKGPLPLVVSIHGGPTSSSLYAFRYYLGGQTLFASRGWALFDPNYRGSTGYGDRFLTDLIGRENDVEVTDILSGVDALIREGIVDPERMAVMGWSNGGYLTNCIIARDQRFKAASSGAGVFDMAMQWSIEDTPGHVINYMRGLPWEQAEEMRRSSPLYDAHKIVTPTLIHVGEKDERVPPEHSRGLYRALRHYLNVPTELIVYPGAGHGLTKYSHRKAKLSWDVRWLDHHVLGKPGEEME
jgi:dipeptidyl aminopeptidase/acylaminoacyl peptidase